MANPVCYSRRLLNPFAGMMQIIDADNARAVSIDGVNWRIQIQSEIFKSPWHELEISKPQQHYFVYGVWSKIDGLAKAPIHPTLYQEHVKHSAEDLVTHLLQRHKMIPFPAMDIYECWLLDKYEQLPLVLINSEISEQKIDLPKSPYWLACEQQDQSFISNIHNQRRDKAAKPLLAKDLLTNLVKSHTGSPATVVWVQRDEQGQGLLLKHSQKTELKLEERIPVAQFPRLGIRQQWDTEEAEQLVSDYINWLSPKLLTMPDLEPEMRRQLEITAQQQPLLVDTYYRLYTEIIDRPLINKILVEAALRKNSSPQNKT